jgi:mono/diheme cytochrome c family protein
MKRIVLLAWMGAAVAAQAEEPLFSQGWRFDQHDGRAIFHAICAGCHMPQGQGAQGAGAYPALAGNPRVAAAAYVAQMVLRGRAAMPAFKDQLDDAQIAAVASYVQRELGPPNGVPVSTAEVAALRGSLPSLEKP